MKKIHLLSFFFFFGGLMLTAQVKSEYFDGPYLFHQNDSLRIQWVERGVGHDTLIANNALGQFDRNGLPTIDEQNQWSFGKGHWLF